MKPLKLTKLMKLTKPLKSRGFPIRLAIRFPIHPAISLAAALCVTASAQMISATDAASATSATKVANDDSKDLVVHMTEYRVYAVKDFAGGQLAPDEKIGFLGDLQIMDAPFAANRYTAALIENQHARTITDVLNNDPSARPALGYGNFEQMFSIRGFTLYNSDISFGGLYGALPRQVTVTEMIDSVEVLKGASALINGIAPYGSGIGGAINIQPKRATYAPVSRVTADYTNNSFAGWHADLGRRAGRDKQFGIRINSVYRNGETSIKDEHREQGLVSIGADYKTARLRLSVDLAYQNYRIDRGRPAVFVTTYPAGTLPRAPRSGENFGQAWTYSYTQSYFGMMRAEVDATEWLTVYAGLGGATDDEYGAYSSPYLGNAGGDALASLLEVPYKDNNRSHDLGLRARFKTGSIKHSINLGYAETHLKKRAAYEMGVRTNVTNIYTGAQFAKPAVAYRGGDMLNPGVTGRTATNGIALADVVSMSDDRLTLIGGVRWQKIRNSAFAYTGAQTDRYNEDAITPGGGVVFKPWEKVSLYINYMEGLQQGPVAPATVTNAGEVFAPFRTKQYEAGIKIELGAFLATASVFQLAQPVGVTDPVANRYDADGETRNRGLEISGVGEIRPGVRLLGGVMFMDSELRGMKNAATNGNRAFGVPVTTLNMGVEWDMPWLKGLTLFARGIHTSKQYADAASQTAIPGWMRWDAGVRHKMTVGKTPLTICANMDNILDNNYWSSAGFTSAGYVTVGAPRTFVLSVTADF